MISELTARMVFLGGPGAGKGTQAKKLAETHGVLHISTGDMLREHRARGTDLGKQAQGYMDRGQLVPDEVIIGMVRERISRPDATGAWILDGFPRTLPQAESLDTILADSDQDLSHVFHFKVPEPVLFERLTARWTCAKCGAIWNTQFKPTKTAGVCDRCGGALSQRPDDRPEAVTKRLAVYRAETEPLLDYYASLDVLVEIDANRAPELVLADLVLELKQ